MVSPSLLVSEVIGAIRHGSCYVKYYSLAGAFLPHRSAFSSHRRYIAKVCHGIIPAPHLQMNEQPCVSRLRNVGLFAHIDAGKTTTTEAVLYTTHEIYSLGSVNHGTTAMDFMEQEKQRGITIRAAVTSCSWKDHQINIIDTPGHVDFAGEVRQACSVLDAAVVVLDASRGVETQTVTVWNQLNKWELPRLVFANKLDRPGAAMNLVEESLREAFGRQMPPIVVALSFLREPDSRGGGSRGRNLLEKRRGSPAGSVVDLVSLQIINYSCDVPGQPYRAQEVPVSVANAQLSSVVHDEIRWWRSKMLETIAECDEKFEALYLTVQDEQAIPGAEVKAALRRITVECRGYPVLCGSALRNFGVEQLLDGILCYFPSPIKPNTRTTLQKYVPLVQNVAEDVKKAFSGTRPTTSRYSYGGNTSCLAQTTNQRTSRSSFAQYIGPRIVQCRSAVAPTALAYKVLPDTQGGKSVFIRVYSGVIAAGTTLFNTSSGLWQQIKGVYRIKADRYVAVEELIAGDTGMIRGLQETQAGDTLISQYEPDPFSFYCGDLRKKPLCSVAIEPVLARDEERILRGLQDLTVEDPSLKLVIEPQSQQIQLWGMGQLHLRIAQERLRDEYGVDSHMGRMEISYLETLLAPAELTESLESETQSNDDTQTDLGLFGFRLNPRKLPCVTEGEGCFDDAALENRLFILGPPRDSNTQKSMMPRDPCRVRIVDGSPAFDNGRGPSVSYALIKLLHEEMVSQLSFGPQSGFPVVAVDVFVDVIRHPTAKAAQQALRSKLHNAFQNLLRPNGHSVPSALLEPVLRVEISISDNSLKPAILGALAASARGSILRTDLRLHTFGEQYDVVEAIIPLATVNDFSTFFRRITKGSGELHMEPWGYSPADAQVIEQQLN